MFHRLRADIATALTLPHRHMFQSLHLHVCATVGIKKNDIDFTYIYFICEDTFAMRRSSAAGSTITTLQAICRFDFLFGSCPCCVCVGSVLGNTGFLPQYKNMLMSQWSTWPKVRREMEKWKIERKIFVLLRGPDLSIYITALLPNRSWGATTTPITLSAGRADLEMELTTLPAKMFLKVWSEMTSGVFWSLIDHLIFHTFISHLCGFPAKVKLFLECMLSNLSSDKLKHNLFFLSWRRHCCSPSAELNW